MWLQHSNRCRHFDFLKILQKKKWVCDHCDEGVVVCGWVGDCEFSQVL